MINKDFKAKVLEKIKDDKYDKMISLMQSSYIDDIYNYCRKIYDMLKNANLIPVDGKFKINYSEPYLIELATAAEKISKDNNINVDIVLDFMKDAFIYSITEEDKNKLFACIMDYQKVIPVGIAGNKIDSFMNDWDNIKTEIKTRIKK